MLNNKTKIVSAILAFVLTISLFSLGVSAATSAAGIIEASGHLESAYVMWGEVDGADGYNVYVTRYGSTDWRRIDDMLVRRYSDYWRADVVGLKAGRYQMKVVPTKNGSEMTNKSLITNALTVQAHDRSGFAFDARSPFGTASGAYNDDGTLKSNAQVVYVTAATAKTCKATVNGKEYVGFQSILDAKQKQGTNEPICFRIVGLVTLDDLDHISSDSEGLQIKGKNSYNEMNITIEGIGADATIYGFGILIRNAKNVEIRNLGIMNFMDDGISVDTDNSNLWIHNCDFFYGQVGSDSDQVKGDGSLDTKKSQYITYSYNHFYDSGKVHLVGNGSSDSVNYLTFHHNWYDHADSRMPRVRSATVHVYNNFYDGVSKYGIGSTLDSDIFSEANYFLNTKHPMLISKQGSDIAESSKGTFSGENGGIIKSYGDVMVGSYTFVSYQQNNTQFDAYVASSRNEKLTSSVKAVAGGATYNNFDTDPNFYSYTAQNANDAMATVKQYAGRVGGGDLTWSFTNSDNSSYDVNVGLQNAVKNYKSTVVSIGGTGDKFVSDNDYHTGFEDVVEPEPHVHSYTGEKVDPTCTEGGYITHECECGDSYTQTVPATGHTFTEGVCADCGAADPNYVPDVDDPVVPPVDPDNGEDGEDGEDTPTDPDNGENTDPDSGENGNDTPNEPDNGENNGDESEENTPIPPANSSNSKPGVKPNDNGENLNFFQRFWRSFINFFRMLFGLDPK